MPSDKTILDEVTRRFYSLFSNKNGHTPHVAGIYELCIPQAQIIRNVGSDPEIYTLENFIRPREIILQDGTLTDFEESEVSETTEIFGRIAARFSRYHKSGILSGRPFETDGAKAFQFVMTPQGWKISAVAWDDAP